MLPGRATSDVAVADPAETGRSAAIDVTVGVDVASVAGVDALLEVGDDERHGHLDDRVIGIVGLDATSAR